MRLGSGLGSGRPNRLYDFVVLAAFAPDRSWVKVAELLVIPLDEDDDSAAGKEFAPGEVSQDIQDEFL